MRIKQINTSKNLKVLDLKPISIAPWFREVIIEYRAKLKLGLMPKRSNIKL